MRPVVVFVPALLLIALACGCVTAPAKQESPATPAAGAGTAAAADGPPLARSPVSGLDFPIITRHAGVFGGRRLAYTATVSAVDVNDSDGKPGARIVSTAYVVDRGTVAAKRPVMFVFNGGPISPSVFLHMGAFGPKRVAFPDDLSVDATTAPAVDNPYSILDVADLVYFDPAGTGFSRTLPGKSLEEYFSIAADAQQTAAFIAAWLDANGRKGSPVYVFGESYGTNRAVEAARQLAELPEPVLLDGVVLFGQAVNIIEYAQRPKNIISYVVSLPTLAALGWYHGKADTQGASLEEFVDAAWNYASTEYLQALFLGASLPDQRLKEVAAQLERFTGLDAEYFADKRLRVSKEDYRVRLFQDEGLILGRSDGRYLGPAGTEGGQAREDATDPAADLPQALIAAFLAYAVSDLGVPSIDQYVISSPVQRLDQWDWGDRTPFSRFDYGAALDDLLARNPHARVLVAAGYFDTMTTIGASQHLFNQESWPADRVILKFYRGGHMAYSIADTARLMADDLRELMRGR